MATVAIEDFQDEALGDFDYSGIFVDPSSGANPAQVITSSGVADFATLGIGAYNGTKLLRCNHFGSTTFEGVGFNWAPYYTDEALIRFWFRFDQNLAYEPGLHFSRHLDGVWDWLDGNYGAGATPDGWKAELWIDDGGQTEVLPTAYGAAGTQDGTTKGPHDCTAWHKSERYWKLSTGVAKHRIDEGANGNLNQSHTSVNWGAYKWDYFDLISNWTPAPGDSTNYIYIGRIEIYTDRDDVGGLPTTGSMSDFSISPATPKRSVPLILG